MPKLIFDTKTLTLSEILGNAKVYAVPKYQRSYSWEIEQWEDLWQDIMELKRNEENIHYLGTIVLKTLDNKSFEVIDGQQRLATLSFIILACIKVLDEFIENGIETKKNKERKEIYMNSYIGFKEPKSLTYKPKVTLNHFDKDLYNAYLIQLKQPQNISRLPDSNKLMLKSFNYFFEKIKSLNFKSGDEIVDFIENVILNKLILIQIVVEDTLSAYTVFETLNARGIELTTTDLLKNYLFSLLDNEIDINNMLPIWDRIVNTISYREFPTFLRYYLNSRQNLIRNERLFKEIRNKVVFKEQVFELLNDLEINSDLYLAFDEPLHELWSEIPEVQRLVEEIKLFGVKQHKSLLLSCYAKKPELFTKILRIIRAITFRYNVIGKFNPNDLEKAYNKTAVKIFDSKITTLSEIQSDLSSVYLNDEKFKNIFLTKSFNTQHTKEKKLVRYILTSIENQKYNKDYHLFESDATIEHIFPENLNSQSQIDKEMIYRLGNLTLLEPKLNKEAGNKPFKEKLIIYKKSQYDITKDIAERWDNWGNNEIKTRQREFSDLATSIWRSDY